MNRAAITSAIVALGISPELVREADAQQIDAALNGIAGVLSVMEDAASELRDQADKVAAEWERSNFRRGTNGERAFAAIEADRDWLRPRYNALCKTQATLAVRRAALVREDAPVVIGVSSAVERAREKLAVLQGGGK